MMESSGFSSPRTECFPAGLRVLVVDDDPTWLKILEKMLKKCNYEVSVTTCNLARDALNLLRERKDGFDIVISDVNMPDMDGFRLLEHVGLEMDLPVIMMSVDGETSRVMKGVQHGACDYLLKPIRMKELRNIWQHVFRKRIHEVRDIEGYESIEEINNMMRCGTEQFEDGFLFSGDFITGKKRKDVDSKYDDRVCGESSSSAKKARVVWTVDLHQKFVRAVNQIGFEKVGPKKILDLMGVPWLTRENVASHLQKYRLYLSRLQKENELKSTFGVTKELDIFSKDHSISAHQIIQANETHAEKICDKNDLAKTSASIRTDFYPDVKSEPKIQVHYSWNSEAPPLQLIKKDGNNKTVHFHSEYTFDKRAQTGPTPWNTSGPHSFNVLETPSTAEAAIRLWDEEFNDYSPQGDFYPPINAYIGYDNQELIDDVPPHLYDSLKFDSSVGPGESVEYHVIDQGLFA
ncbi:hypothetical protein ABFS83_05G023700 [Erythranthe nasuta]